MRLFLKYLPVGCTGYAKRPRSLATKAGHDEGERRTDDASRLVYNNELLSRVSVYEADRVGGNWRFMAVGDVPMSASQTPDHTETSERGRTQAGLRSG